MTCEKCRGVGEVQVYEYGTAIPGVDRRWITCTKCNGRGWVMGGA